MQSSKMFYLKEKKIKIFLFALYIEKWMEKVENSVVCYNEDILFCLNAKP